MTTPEAEPKDKKKPAEQEESGGEKKKEKKEKKEGDDGAATPISREQKKKIIEEYLKERQAGKEEEEGDNRETEENGEPEVSASLWRTSRETVREPLGKLFKYGTIAAMPIPAAMVWGADKIARNTISRIPIVGNVYEGPRSVITWMGRTTRDALAGTITSPALPLDVAGNVIQGITGRTKSEEKGFIGRSAEVLSERAGALLRGGYKLGENILTKGANIAKGTVETVAKLVWGTAKIPFEATHMVFGATAAGAKAGLKTGLKHGLGGAVSAATMLGLGWGAVALGAHWGVLPASWTSGYWPALGQGAMWILTKAGSLIGIGG